MAKTQKEIQALAQVKSIIADISSVSLRSGNYMSHYDEMWKRVTELDKSVGEGLQIGRMVKWHVCDGYACYFVVGINKASCKLAHIDLGDGYTSPVVYEGKAIRGVVEQSIQRSDGWRKMLEEQQAKKAAS